METTIKSGKHLAVNSNLTGTRFENVCLTDSEFENVNLAGAKLHNINLSDITITAAQFGGATFKHIGLPPGSSGKQRPLRFEEADLNGTVIQNCNLTNMKIDNCIIQGMTIDGITVTELLSAYSKKK